MSVEYSRRDVGLLKRCMTEHWATTEEQRRRIMGKLMDLAMDEDEFTSLRAIRTIRDLERLDISALQVAVAAKIATELEKRNEDDRDRDIGDGELAVGIARLLEPRESSDGDVGVVPASPVVVPMARDGVPGSVAG